MEVYVNGKQLRLNTSKSMKGGEADVYVLNDKAVKIFKPPEHPDFENLLHEQKMARFRIEEHQKKLRAFPKNLPGEVVAPEELVTDKKGKIIGYVMKFLKGAENLFAYSRKPFRRAGGIPNSFMLEILKNLYVPVPVLHERGVIISDFNDLNVLVLGSQIYLIDADSYGFGGFLCNVFTPEFVDPMLCDPDADAPVLIKPYTYYSDWYSFSVIILRCFLFIPGPYAGIYKPKDPKKRIIESARFKKRITVFNPEVGYPKNALHYKILPDDMLHYLSEVFENDRRENFPKNLLEEMRWTKCTVCGTEHARNICPECSRPAPAAIIRTVTVRGKVKAERIFRTAGIIVFSGLKGSKPGWLSHEKNEFKNESGEVVFKGSLEPNVRYRFFGNEILIGKGNDCIVLLNGTVSKKFVIDSYRSVPLFETNENYHYWIDGGRLYRNGEFGPFYLCDVLPEQTLFWVGPDFGFGFYRAGNIGVSFVFDAEKTGINDSVKVPLGKGHLLYADCVFTSERCWFFHVTQEGARTIYRLAVIKKNGTVEAVFESDDTKRDWIFGIGGKCAVSKFLFAATDEGIIRLEVQNGQIVKTREFPDTEPFVSKENCLFAASDAIYVVKEQEILILKME